jgi:hydrogenase/urease accessory protein HupE
VNRAVVVCALLIAPASASAHAFNPALLELRAGEHGLVEVTWKVTSSGEASEPLRPLLPATCRAVTPHAVSSLGAIVLERWRTDCGPRGLVGQTVAITGFVVTDQDVLVRIATAEDARIDVVLRPGAESFVVPEHPDHLAVFATYVRLGVGHILSGDDHLLFVLGLILLVAPARRLLVTISAFTLAHSITLSLAALHVVRFPTRAVEAVIALSVVSLAVEVARGPSAPSLASRSPWVVAFAFGLLHGFGFAGALAELGLPDGDIPLALLGFNGGVELGQLLFVAGVLAVLRAVAWLELPWRAEGRKASVYVIGSLSAYWCCERVAMFWQ